MFNVWRENRKLKQHLHDLILAAEQLQKRSILIGIETSGRKIIFTFARNDEMVQIETMRLISDNIIEWKEKLL